MVLKAKNNPNEVSSPQGEMKIYYPFRFQLSFTLEFSPILGPWLPRGNASEHLASEIPKLSSAPYSTERVIAMKLLQNL